MERFERMNGSVGRTSVAGGLLALLLLGVGCSLFDDDTPDEVRIRLSEADVAEQVLVVSEQFLTDQVSVLGPDGVTVIGTETRVEILEADTLRVAAPFDRTFDISDSRRFYAVTLGAPDGLRMRAEVDGDRKYDAVAGGGQGKLEFIYSFTNISDPDDPRL